MTAAPCCLAYFSICAPTPEVSGSTMSTLAPLVMSACAWLTCVALSPCAFCTLKSDEVSPAAWKAFVSSGASNSTYRADVVVSGRRTPILPFPLAARSLSCAMAAKSGVRLLALTSGTLPEPELLLPGLGAPPDELPPQAASVISPPTASAATAAFRLMNIFLLLSGFADAAELPIHRTRVRADWPTAAPGSPRAARSRCHPALRRGRRGQR